MTEPTSSDRFNEDKATYTVRGSDAPDLAAGVAAIRNVLKKFTVGCVLLAVGFFVLVLGTR